MPQQCICDNAKLRAVVCTNRCMQLGRFYNYSVTIGYLTYMLFFGAFALYLRVLTKSIWTGVGFHLMFVFMNQLIGLEPTNLIQFSEFSSERPVQITLIRMLGLTFIALLAYPKLKGLKL